MELKRRTPLPYRRMSEATFFAVLGTLSVILTGYGLAQDSSKAEPQTEIFLNTLARPIYPPLARQARIVGDVRIQLEIRSDGSVESAEVVSGLS